jgi:hypothetical protein
MRMILRWLAVLAIGAVLQGSLLGLAVAQGPAPGLSPANPGPGYGGGVPDQASNPAAPTESEPATALPVLYVTSVEILRTQTEPQLDIVRVTGLTGLQDWNSPELLPTFAGKPLDGILDLQFTATMPLRTERSIEWRWPSTVSSRATAPMQRCGGLRSTARKGQCRYRLPLRWMSAMATVSIRAKTGRWAAPILPGSTAATPIGSMPSLPIIGGRDIWTPGSTVGGRSTNFRKPWRSTGSVCCTAAAPHPAIIFSRAGRSPTACVQAAAAPLSSSSTTR